MCIIVPMAQDQDNFVTYIAGSCPRVIGENSFLPSGSSVLPRAAAAWRGAWGSEGVAFEEVLSLFRLEQAQVLSRCRRR
jgi:hypothetical protein